MALWIRYAKKCCMRLVLLPLRLLPLKANRVLLLNDLSYNYSDNPKYLAEKLLEKYPNTFEIIFPVKDPQLFPRLRQKGLSPVIFNSLSYFYYAMTAAVFVTNNGGYSYIPLRKAQLVINTWHGGGAYKKDALACMDTPVFRKELRLSAKPLDYFLATNWFSKAVMSVSHAIPEEKFWMIGMPRNDILIKNAPGAADAVKTGLGFAPGEKMVLFAPTFRRENGQLTGRQISIHYDLDYESVCAALQKRFGGTWRMGLRLHPSVKDNAASGENVLNLSDYEDMQELLLAADVLITDFSSSMWDFSLTGRPCFLFARDFYEYLEITGVYMPVEQWPFPKAVSNEELTDNIRGFDAEAYRLALQKHHTDLGICETGWSAEKCSELIFDTYSS